MSGPRLTRRSLVAGIPPAATALALAGSVLPSTAAAQPARPWLSGWGRALVPHGGRDPIDASSTYRERLRTSLGGSLVRIVISNEHGDIPLSLAGAALRAEGTGAFVPLSFGGLPGIVIPPGAAIVSDHAPISIAANGSLEISLLIDKPASSATGERRGQATGASLAPGLQPHAPALASARDTNPLFIKGLEVQVDAPRGVLVVLSDTKSAGSETWAPMLAANAAGRFGVVNRSVYAGHLALGPVGASALARFDREVLATTGVSHVLIFTGNNDLIQPGMFNSRGEPSLDPALAMSAEALIALLQQCVARTRAANLVAVGGTWLPYEGVTIAQGYSTPEKLAKREAINDWVRSPNAFDIVVDFDQALRDPADLSRLAAQFDEGNHFTPNAAGYAVMAELVHRTISPL